MKIIALITNKNNFCLKANLCHFCCKIDFSAYISIG